ncbi:Uncharacterised protein [Moraxella caprae]|uniref:Uncharacterized protein n=1 Tax=Moraxella caprae TaxID=90240 RepID=A0A378QYV1_9GAMM|nr:hypothetical protein [Moraxella caprae]STZ07637.1 Uncharacterised protein [Moraxella caprae]
MNEKLENNYPAKKVIKNYMIFGTLSFNFPIFIFSLWLIIFDGNPLANLLIMISLICSVISSIIVFAITAYFISDLKITITKPADYYKPFLVAFVVSLVIFFLMSFMVLGMLSVLYLVLSVLVGVISVILAKFLLPKS